MKLKETDGKLVLKSNDGQQKVTLWKIKTQGGHMSNLKNHIDNLGETIGKLSWISNNCGDAGLKLLLEDIEHELMQTHEYFRFHEEEGILTESNSE